jgi:hypothetical protein
MGGNCGKNQTSLAVFESPIIGIKPAAKEKIAK